MPTPEATYVGLDVAKDRLDYTVDGLRCDHVPNTASGHERLLAALRPLGGVRVICEATGGYERAIVAALLLAKLEVCVVKPGRVRAFAHAEGLLAKTDRLDAQLLRRFGQKVQPRLHIPMDQAALTLRELLDYGRQVSDQLVAVRDRLRMALTRHLQFPAQAAEHLAHPALAQLFPGAFLDPRLGARPRLSELPGFQPPDKLRAHRPAQISSFV